MKTDKFIIGQFPMLKIVDKNGCKNRMPEDYLPAMSQEMYNDFVNGKLASIKLFKNKAYNLISHLGKRRNSV
jgi:hypothetical protein